VVAALAVISAKNCAQKVVENVATLEHGRVIEWSLERRSINPASNGVRH